MQGSLQKSSGKPFDNGFHAITFKLYEVEDGGVAIWTENQPKVLVESGLYEATLGSIVPLRLPFNKRYYLGIAVNGEDELSPRAIVEMPLMQQPLLEMIMFFPPVARWVLEHFLPIPMPICFTCETCPVMELY